MSDIVIVYDDVQEGSDCADVGQIVRGDGRTLLLSSDVVGNVALDIIERRTQTAVYSTTFAPSGTGPVYNTPQLDNYWGLDTIGYNFRYLPTVIALGAAAWKGGRTYDHVYRFTTGSYGVIRAVFRRHVLSGVV